MTNSNLVYQISHTLTSPLSAVQRCAHSVGDPVGRRALRRGVLPHVVASTLLRRLSPSLVIDVGANRGQFTLASILSLPRIAIIAFEPVESEYQVLEAWSVGQPVTLLPLALGAEDATCAMHLSRKRDNSSLRVPTKVQLDAFAEATIEHSVDVPVRRLDSLHELEIPPNVFMKIDTQGTELEVVRGAARVLPNIRWLFLEMSFRELYEGQPSFSEAVDELKECGYRMREVSSLTLHTSTREPLQADVLFERDSS